MFSKTALLPTILLVLYAKVWMGVFRICRLNCLTDLDVITKTLYYLCSRA